MKEKVFEDFQDKIIWFTNSLCINNMFDFFVDEKQIPELIKVCKKVGLNRYDLIDFIKSEMLDHILANDELADNDDLQEELEKDIELLTVDFLAKHINHLNKTSILINLKSKYPAIFRVVFYRVLLDIQILIDDMRDIGFEVVENVFYDI